MSPLAFANVFFIEYQIHKVVIKRKREISLQTVDNEASEKFFEESSVNLFNSLSSNLLDHTGIVPPSSPNCFRF